MTRKTIKRSVDKGKAKDYQKVAESFYGGAEAAKEFEYWNAAGVLIVHSAIAYADAVGIKFGVLKVKGKIITRQ